MSGQTITGPSSTSQSPRTDVTDASELREELICLVEDADANDLERAEQRVTQLLSDFRRAIADQRGDD
jgi:hypothetical protein